MPQKDIVNYQVKFKNEQTTFQSKINDELLLFFCKL